ncbi:unnamed protein product [Vicia faba]|uniref:Uncharacterized protein n=1 Tax=Vicia faba TaxID=3906 RepID=A0AAV0ZPA1_VICFA|nr:unnamed protein product [Vicia faba]
MMKVMKQVFSPNYREFRAHIFHVGVEVKPYELLWRIAITVCPLVGLLSVIQILKNTANNNESYNRIEREEDYDIARTLMQMSAYGLKRLQQGTIIFALDSCLQCSFLQPGLISSRWNYVES